MTDTLKLTTKLINRKTLTPDDNGCQKIIAERLIKNRFNAEHLRFDDVDNLWITHGNSGPLFVFAGHTDTVPVGPIEKWNTDPFKAEIKATIVLPLPTSPCNNLNILLFEDKSLLISFNVLF